MQLKKLELLGFKSFADRTEFSFEPGITGFVGPNGCGKSNVVDAVKWILGEQSAKSLRGSEMADVIFNGNPSRRSLGYAEASLTIDNSKRRLPVEFEEVCVTRRLYRSGESQYLLNNQPCRLRDLREMFMDTGVGTSSYSVIEQGKVDMLLQANAQERRLVFEEAAGISKYKAKKRAALSKLDRVEQNMLRLNDLIGEVQRQLRSVKIQAGRARRYKEITDKLRELRVALSVRTFRALAAEAKAGESFLGELEDQIQGVTVKISAIEAEIAAYEQSAIALEKQISETRERRAQTDVAMTDADASIQHNQRWIKELGEREIRLDEQAQTLAARLEEMRDELASAKSTLQALRAEVKAAEADVQEKQAEIEQIASQRVELSAGIERRKADVLEIMRQMSQLQNELVTSRTSRLNRSSTKSRLQNRCQEIEGEISQLSQEREEILAEHGRLEATAKRLAQRLEDSQTELGRVTEEGEQLAVDISDAMQTRSGRQSRRDLLREMEVQAEGIDASVQHVLAQAREGRLAGVDGTFVDSIRAPELQYAIAIDAALGPRAQAVLTDSTSAAVAAMSLLTQDGKGRCTFLPRDRVQAKTVANEAILGDSGVVGRASALVQSAPETAPLVEHLLGDTVVVKDTHVAAKLATNGGSDCRVVTLDGWVFEPRGTVVGGSKEGAMGIVTRRAELETIEDELRDLAKKIEELQQQKADRATSAQRLRELIDETRRAIEDHNLRKQAREAEAGQREREINALSEERAVAKSEVDDIVQWIEQAQQKEAELTRGTEGLEQRSASLEHEVQEHSQLLRGKDEEQNALASRLTDLRVLLGQKQEKARNLVDTIDGIERGLQEREAERDAAIQGSQDAVRKKAEAKLEIERNQELLVRLSAEKEHIETELNTLAEKQQDLRRRLGESNDQARAFRSKLRELEEQAHQHKLKQAEITAKMGNLAERIREEYEIDLVERVREQPEDPDLEWDQVEAEISALREQLSRIGSVNLEAIDELDELEIREKFLTNQREDLLKSQRQLQDIIRKINRTSRDLFEKTYNAVRENFQDMFRKLFGGGSADIVLEEGVDILEAGIEVIARPPGKQPRSISLLSGGEKTMTTVALLFAIFKSKPSPFCILDEVDAALDESNIGRFVSLLEEFTELSQFIIVTHSKRTMAVADVLYGITMQESGISKKVSVKFEGGSKQVA